jgi:hypothetical protein
MRYENFLVEVDKREKEMAVKYKNVPVEQIPLEDLWVFMSKGNLKLSKKIKIFNLPAIQSCPNSSQCAKFCYARKAERQYPAVRAARGRNFRLAKEAPELLKKQILSKLESGDIVRIHESGDMFSQAYLDMWFEIAKERPDVRFYTYTKTEHIWDFGKIKSLPNFNVVSSFVGGKVNFGPEQEINIRAGETGAFVCPCKPGNKVVCGETCTACQTRSDVLFVQH